jgi:hypothetical protein
MFTVPDFGFGINPLSPNTLPNLLPFHHIGVATICQNQTIFFWIFAKYSLSNIFCSHFCSLALSPLQKLKL